MCEFDVSPTMLIDGRRRCRCSHIDDDDGRVRFLTDSGSASSFLFALTVASLLAIVNGYDQCGFPGEPSNGGASPVKPDYDLRDTVTYVCNSGYVLVGAHQITCRKESTWSSDTPQCLQEAAEIERSAISDDNVNTCVEVTNTKGLKLRTSPFSQHSIKSIVISFSKVTGSPNVEVTFSNDGSNPQNCVTVPNILFQDSNLYHNFDCGRVLIGNTVHVTIRPMRAFSPVASVTICEIGITAAYVGKLKCGSAQIPANGSIRNQTEDRVAYGCVRGFYIEGSATSHCDNGVWKNQVHCKSVLFNCGFPGSPINGFTEYADAVTGTIRYECLPGFLLVGPSIRSCLMNGTWSPQSIPKCLTNVAFGKYVSHSDMSRSDDKPSVDGNLETCDVVGYHQRDKTQQRWWKVEFDSPQLVSNIRVIQPRGQQKRLKVAYFYDDVSPRANVPCVVSHDMGLVCELTSPVSSRGIYILPEEKQDNVTLCEVQVTNRLEQVQCGTVDEQLNSRVTYKQNNALFLCDAGYTLHGPFAVNCENGSWKPPYPTCTIAAGGHTTLAPKTVTPSRKSPSGRTFGTTPAAFEHHEAEKDSFMVGIMGIAIGVTAASVSIIIAVVVIVCIMKRHYRKKQHTCNHNCSSGHHTSSTTYNNSGGGGGSPRDWDESSIHLYETVKPEYETLDPSDQSLVVNESYVLTSPKNTLNGNPTMLMRPRLAPPRSNHIYDVVAAEESLLDRDGRPREAIVVTNGHGTSSSACPRDSYFESPNLPRTDL